MAEQTDETVPKINLGLTSEVAQQLKDKVDNIVASGQPGSITLHLSKEAHAAFSSQLAQTSHVASALVQHVPSEEEELPHPEEEEAEEETEPETESESPPDA